MDWSISALFGNKKKSLKQLGHVYIFKKLFIEGAFFDKKAALIIWYVDTRQNLLKMFQGD